MVSIGQITHYVQTVRRQVVNIYTDLFFFRFFKIALLIFVLLNSSLWLAAYYILKTLDQPQIALHYNVDFGVDYYGVANNIFVLPVLGLAIYIVNVILLAIVRNQQDRKFIGQILCIVAVLANLILLAGMASIYLINF